MSCVWLCSLALLAATKDDTDENLSSVWFQSYCLHSHYHYHLHLLLWCDQRNSRPQDPFSRWFSDSLSMSANWNCRHCQIFRSSCCSSPGLSFLLTLSLSVSCSPPTLSVVRCYLTHTELGHTETTLPWLIYVNKMWSEDSYLVLPSWQSLNFPPLTRLTGLSLLTH